MSRYRQWSSFMNVLGTPQLVLTERLFLKP
jgi:hypothetical protein